MGKEERHGIPDYRVAAFASLDLKQHMTDAAEGFHFEKSVQDIDWKVKHEKGYYVAEGELRVPFKMYFTAEDDKEDALFVERVVCNGKRVFDARVSDDEDDEDPNFGMDVDSVRAESFVRYQSNIGGRNKQI